ncbi:MAG: CHAT domain-containing protein, partial [Spirulinaceae cyanobacterium]
LGNAYSSRIRGEKVENIEAAISAFQAALEIHTHEAFPKLWADTHNNLGNAYRGRIRGEKVENIEAAISAFQAALEIHTRQAFPEVYVTTSFNLGLAYRNNQRLIEAYDKLKKALEADESLREEIISDSEAKQKQAEKSIQFYQVMVLTCLDLNKLDKAFEYAERSKNRNLVEQILERDRNTIFPPEVAKQLEKLRDVIASGQQQIQSGKAQNHQELAEYLQQLRQQRNQLQDKYLSVGSGFKFEQLQANLAENTAIIEWYLTAEEIVAFVFGKDSQLTAWRSTTEDQKALFDRANEYLREYYNNRTNWRNSLPARLNNFAEILHLEEILKLIPKTYSRLILVPHRYLHLFPLHALQSKRQTTKGEVTGTLMELFPDGVSYAPSCQLLQQLQTRKRPNFQSLFAIQNPTEDLTYTDLEVEKISSLFSSQILPGKQATKTALTEAKNQLQTANYLHFSCHGTFNLKSPQNSCLLLADTEDSEGKIDLNKCLTLGNLFERDFNLPNCRLVVLSACETGLVDFNNTSDEYIGLPSGFLYAGSSNVVSSLWTVSDLSTAFLMLKFIQNLKAKENISVPLALN